MNDQTVATIHTAPLPEVSSTLPEVSSTFPQIAVLAALAATGTLATNILLPSLPQMAASLHVSTAAVTSAITVFLAVFAVGQLVVGPISDRYGRRWPVLSGFAGVFAGIGARAYGAGLGGPHTSPGIPLNPLAIARTYGSLIADRRFLMPAATVSLIMGGLFAMFSAAPRVLIEGLLFTPIQLGLFFAGTVMIVFAAGMLATKIAPRFGLDRSIQGGLLAAATGSVGILLVSVFPPTFLPFLAAMCVFLLGMGIVNPLGTAQALSPFGEKAGAASALVGFWQMMSAAAAGWPTATVSPGATFALR